MVCVFAIVSLLSLARAAHPHLSPMIVASCSNNVKGQNERMASSAILGENFTIARYLTGNGASTLPAVYIWYATWPEPAAISAITTYCANCAQENRPACAARRHTPARFAA